MDANEALKVGTEHKILSHFLIIVFFTGWITEMSVIILFLAAEIRRQNLFRQIIKKKHSTILYFFFFGGGGRSWELIQTNETLVELIGECFKILSPG